MRQDRIPFIVLAILLLPSLAGATTATITIDAGQRGAAINPRMYGIFLEEINHGVDGGLYAELVRNRAFEDSRAPEGYTLRNGRWIDPGGARAGFDRFGYATEGVPFWSLVQEGQATGSMHLEKTGGITDESCYCLRMEIENAADGRVGVANEGFFGIGVQQNLSYALSLYAKGAKGFSGPLTVRLEDASGNPCSDAIRITGIGADWKQFHATLTASKTEGKGRLVITAGDTGTLWLDFVSLFPAQTWKGRDNGLRRDIAQMIADLRPGFVRFPGGCVVESGTVETAYNWKLTVGPVEQRQERWGPWMYRETHGMGLYEYFQFCQDLGAEPLWVGFAGQTCIFRERELVPMEEMGWVRDGFLDIMEYANGSADSTWGQMRAKAGHPEPFDLKYVEIGNENADAPFGERYRYVYDAMKAKYPNVKYFLDLSWTDLRSLGDVSYDIEDRHYYNPPRWFSSRFHEYDDRDRSRPPLYLGEVAVTSNEGGPTRGNLLAALSEGVFLLGCERNGDTVSMVSYAPLLAHVQGRTELVDAPPPWHAMIYHDNTRVFGTASYYLWKLFGTNHPSYNVQTDVEFTNAGPLGVTGAVGVGTWGTSAEFRNVRVEKAGEVLYDSDFSEGTDAWRPESGRWSAVDGVYRQGSRRNGISIVGDENWSDYTLTLQARKLSGGEGFLVIFGRKGENQYWWNLGGWGNTQHAIEYSQTPVGRPVQGNIETNRWYDIKIELAGERIRCYLDGELIHDVVAPKTEQFFAVAGRDEATGDVVVKAINLDSQAVAGTLNLQNAGRLSSEATVTVLTSDNLTDNNNLDQPKHVVPVDSRIDVAQQFTHEFPPHSMTVMRIKTQ